MDPEVKIIENFMSLEDCNYYIHTYHNQFERSMMTHQINKEVKHYITEKRTSSTCVIPRTDHMIGRLLSTISDILHLDIRNMERPQLTRYIKGECFKLHHDCIPNESNQREYTVILYLNEVEETDGGKTVFPMCDISITPKMGRLIWFRNCDLDGNRIRRAYHIGGEILTDTVKYILTIFIRQRPIEKK